jgi:hypothetical protein
MKLVALATSALTLVGGVPPAWHSYRADRISIRYPPGWTATVHSLTPVTSPAQLLAIASFPLPRTDRGADGCEPKAARDRMPAGGAFIFGWDYGQLPTLELRKNFPPQPVHFELKGLASYECMGRSYMVRFRAAGRGFQIHIYLGSKATTETRATVLHILDSFRARTL